MLKLIGSLLTLTGSFGLGLAYCLDMKKRLWHLEYMYRICMRLESEIRYSHSCIPDICANLAADLDRPYREFFQMIYRRMQENDGSTFDAIWKDACGFLKERLPLKEEEFTLFREFALVGGSPDVNLQEEALGRQMQKLENAVCILKNEMMKKGKMYTSLGILGGLFIIIVLL